MWMDRMASEKPRLMITGASGLLGHALCQAARRRWAVYGVYRRHKPQVPGLHTIQADLTKGRCRHDLIHTLRPRAVIHAAANADVMACEKNPKACDTINRKAPIHLAGLCHQAGIAYLFTSTDLVFDGRRAPYDEAAPTRPICVYGEHKARAEAGVLNHCSHALVCRLPLMFGAGPFSRNHFGVRMLRAIRRSETLHLFEDEFRTPVDIDSAAHGLLTLLGRAEGVFHLGGHARVSRYELGLAMARQLGVDPGMIRPVSIGRMKLAVSRAADCSLVSQKAYDAGYRPLSLQSGLRRFVRRFERLSRYLDSD
jgi:dTDP-4-dehydrorhamnose reductase